MKPEGIKLLLISEGLSTPRITKAFKGLAQEPLSRIRVAFIPTAAYGESSDVAWMQRDIRRFRRLGITRIEMVDLRKYQQAALSTKLEMPMLFLSRVGIRFFL